MQNIVEEGKQDAKYRGGGGQDARYWGGGRAGYKIFLLIHQNFAKDFVV